jgi:pimeloyl-ACP methyl ester carboxylesterase
VLLRPALLAAVVLVLASAACSSDDDVSRAASPSTATGNDDSSPGTATTAPAEGAAVPPTPGPPPLEWTSCGSGAACATLTVPLDYAQPDGETLDLAVIRRPATEPDRRIGALVVNPGGPGASGVDFAASFGDPELRERFDLVSWDPRGVGRSDPNDCDAAATAFRALDPEPDDTAEQAALDGAADRVAVDCTADAGELAAHLDSWSTARDLEQLRRALGEPSLNYLGFSYGTLLGQRYLELFPGSARAVVLDGVVDPTLDLPTLLRDQAGAIEGVLAEMLGEDAEAFDDLARQVESAPLPGGTAGPLDPASLAVAAISASYDPSRSAELLGGLEDASEGDGRALRDLAQRYWGLGDYPAYVGTLCADFAHPVGAEAWRDFAGGLADEAPRVGAATANEILPCAFWDGAEPTGPGPTGSGSDGTGPPVLVVGNTGDAATPYAYAVAVAERLPGGVLVTYEGAGHTSYGRSGCVRAAVLDYLTDLAVPAGGTTCG